MIKRKNIFYTIFIILFLSTSSFGEIQDNLFATVGDKALTDSDVIDEIISVEKVKIFKPSSLVYEQVENVIECSQSEVLFVSSNGWDIAGAAGFGFETAWVNRSKEPIDRLPDKPTYILKNLEAITSFFDN